MALDQKLLRIQSKLKAPKSQYNSFGKYSYRNQEDILEAVKPLLAEEGLTLVVSDNVIEAGGMAIVNATATIFDGEDSVAVSAQAGIDPNRKGMDIAQSFGSSSSYARKYALNGLFLIDDTKDADSTNTHGKAAATKPAAKPSGDSDWFTKAIDYIKSAGDKQQAYDMIANKYGASASEKQLAALKKFVG